MTDSRRIPTIAAIGALSWDELIILDRYPLEGGYSMIQRSVSAPGGTTGNIAVAARRLGADVSLLAKVGTDQHGTELIDTLRSAGIRTDGCLTADGDTDLSMVLISELTAERTILWNRGPFIQRRDRIDIDRLFGADVTIIDCVDYELRKFLTDLPAHTRPGACLIGTLTYLADVVACDKMTVALRHDILIGNEREYRELFGGGSGQECFDSVAAAMSGHNLRTAIMTSGARGVQAVAASGRVTVPAREVIAVDTTGAGDAFVGAFAFAHASRWPLERSLTFANAVASCVVASVGAQTGLPSFAEALLAAGFST